MDADFSAYVTEVANQEAKFLDAWVVIRIMSTQKSRPALAFLGIYDTWEEAKDGTERFASGELRWIIAAQKNDEVIRWESEMRQITSGGSEWDLYYIAQKTKRL